MMRVNHSRIDEQDAPAARLSNVTLQINLSPGDVGYAMHTVPALVRAHPRVARRLAVVDLCRPQRTRIFNPERRLPEPEFSVRVAQIRTLTLRLQADGWFDDIVWLEPGTSAFSRLAERYLTRGMTDTHDYGGCANMGYWAAIETPRTRFVLHYDADICLHQSPGFDWSDEALRVWNDYPAAVFASPRISPPGFAKNIAEDAPSQHEGRPLQRVAAGWLNDWFSTRCFLLDRERLAPHLPLMSGRILWEYRIRRLIDRGYPPGPEILLFRVLSARGGRRLNLGDSRAWILHPTHKPPAYLKILPQIISAVAEDRIPVLQRGHSEVNLPAWQEFLGVSPSISRNPHAHSPHR